MAYNNRPMRRSALIGPWGVGAIVPFPNDESLMIAGLDMWRYNDATPFVIKDERLLRRLGVHGTIAHSAAQWKKLHSTSSNLNVSAIHGLTEEGVILRSDTERN